MQALAEARMPDEMEQSERTRLFRPWWEAVSWIADNQDCKPKEAFIKLCVALTRGYVRAADGRRNPLSRSLFPGRLALVSADDCLRSAGTWLEPEQETLICWEDLLQLCPQKRLVSPTASDETKAIAVLADTLRADPGLGREAALKISRHHFPNLSERGFRSRVWPKAREAAGLNPIAPSGRKPTGKPQSP
jgi:hypothetical protein